MNTKAERLEHYEQQSSLWMILLSVAFVAIYAIPVLDTSLSRSTRHLFSVASFVVWLSFAADFAWRVTLADHRVRYVLKHSLDVLFVALPVLRPLRVLRVFTAGQTLVGRTGRFPLMRTTQAIAVTALMLVFIGGVAILDAERSAPGSNIKTASQAFWWSAGDVTTVSYNNAFPVTSMGKIVAIALTVVGLALIGVITAAVAAWFVSQAKSATEQAENDLNGRLDRMEQQMQGMQDAIHAIHESVVSVRGQPSVSASADS